MLTQWQPVDSQRLLLWASRLLLWAGRFGKQECKGFDIFFFFFPFFFGDEIVPRTQRL